MDISGQTFVVTGGCGFIGTHLVRELVERDTGKVLRDAPPAGDIEAQVARLAAELPGLTSEQVRAKLRTLVPEYTPASRSQSPAPANN